ncbi:IS1182 family transposase [Quatrionicoccus australiensis]|uniref:IS1182 family transposase n=1 Tax=Quatrionicoccus australiensis TaxID=138118 RepID=UPI001CF92E1F|nr:IS1182 family transposase [Quatrionicoccus australiensis]
MLKPAYPAQTELEMVTLEQLVPKDHLLRLLDQHIRFDFIREATQHLYCENNGRPAIDPVVLFKMLFIGYLFGIRSERRLVKEIEVNVAYRWFLGFRLTDKLIGGRVLYTDSTHLKANANKRHFEAHQVEQTPAAYLAELDAAIETDRAAAGKKPLKRDDDDSTPPMKEVKVSTVDPDAGFMARDNKPTGFFYLDHRTVDGVHALIVDTHVTPGNVHDSQPYLARLDRVMERFDLAVGAVGLDAGYFTPQVCKGILDRELFGVMGYKRPTHRDGYFYKRDYLYDAVQDCYRCPAGEVLPYRTTNRLGYREYASNPARCADCGVRGQCTQSRNHQKLVTRHLWEGFKEAINANRLSDLGKRLYARRKETVERSFADAKELHGHRYARFRGLAKVQAQCLLSAACQNMKKMALLLARKAAALLAKILGQALFAADFARYYLPMALHHENSRIRLVSA